MTGLRRWLVGMAGILPLTLVVGVASAKTTIRVYHRNEQREMEWMKQIEVEFEKANPDIDVELIPGVGGGGAQYAERLAVLWASGNPPDVFYGSTDKAGYILNGWAKDVTALLNRDRREMDFNDFFPGVFDASTRQGRNYGVPAIAMAQAIFYNKQLFAEAGLAPPSPDWDDPAWTWDAFVAAAEKLTRFGPDGRAVRAGVNGVSLGDLSWLFGGDWFPKEAYETGIATRSTLVSAANEEAYTAAQRLYSDKRLAASGPRSAVSGWEGFWQGVVAMDWTGWWKVRNYVGVKQAGGMNFEWGIAPMPLVKNRSNTRWTDPWFISSATQHPEEAWRFVKFVTSRQGQSSFARYVAFPPSRRSALQSYIDTVSQASGMRPADVLVALSGALQHSRPAIDETIGGSSVFSPIISEELTPALRGERPVRQSLEAAQRRVDAALQELAGRWSKR